MKQILMGVILFVSFVATDQKERTAEIVQLNILHYKEPCWGESLRLCYLLEKKSGETEFFYDRIEGFEYEWGYNYKINVEKVKIEKPRADASCFSYRLKKQISKEKASASLRFELPFVVNGHRLVASSGKNCIYYNTVPVNTGAVSCDSLTHARKGIFQHANDGLRLVSYY